MRSAFVVAMLVPLLALAGCAKRTAKKPSADDSAAVAPAPAPAANEKDRKPKADAPNWLTDPRFKKDKKAGEPVPAQGASNKQPWGVSAPQGGWPGAAPAPNANAGQPNPPPAQPAPNAPAAVPMPAPGVGVLQPQPAATTPVKFSPVGEADMKEVWIFIENTSLASAKMPARVAVFQALVAAESPAAKLVKDGSIILTGTPAREGVWAFETRAITDGGLVASQNGVERLTAAQLKARLGK
jgi:hypothetical protein